MAERYCNTCKEEKPLSEFKKYGTECSTCKRERTEKNKDNVFIQIDIDVNVVYTYQTEIQKKNM